MIRDRTFNLSQLFAVALLFLMTAVCIKNAFKFEGEIHSYLIVLSLVLLESSIVVFGGILGHLIGGKSSFEQGAEITFWVTIPFWVFGMFV